MSLPRTQRVIRGPVAGSDGLELTPQEYFVLSRVEGPVSVRDVLATSGLPPAEAEAILTRLVDLQVLVLSDVAPRTPRPPSGRRLRAKAEQRRRQLLTAALQPGGPPPPPTPVGEAPPSPPDTPPCFGRPVEPMLAALDDPRLDPGLAMDLDDQRWVLALADGIDALDHFSVLGITPTHDLRVIRRAFHGLSRKLHPDAYFGREIGVFQTLLASVFAQAREAQAELQRSEVRTPYVDRFIEELARTRKMAEQQAAARVALDDLQRRDQEAAAELRRTARTQDRARRQRDRLKNRLSAEAGAHVEAAVAAEKRGNLAQAANFYRLAMAGRPDDVRLRREWERTRKSARRVRAADAFAKALTYLEVGHAQEALPLLLEAADADPTSEHLAYAADAVRHVDVAQARNLALSALDALVTDTHTQRRRSELAALHLMIGRAFLAAGQKQSARAQALAAAELRPNDPEARALLKSIKVT